MGRLSYVEFRYWADGIFVDVVWYDLNAIQNMGPIDIPPYRYFRPSRDRMYPPCERWRKCAAPCIVMSLAALTWIIRSQLADVVLAALEMVHRRSASAGARQTSHAPRQDGRNRGDCSRRALRGTGRAAAHLMPELSLPRFPAASAQMKYKRGTAPTMYLK